MDQAERIHWHALIILSHHATFRALQSIHHSNTTLKSADGTNRQAAGYSKKEGPRWLIGKTILRAILDLLNVIDCGETGAFNKNSVELCSFYSPQSSKCKQTRLPRGWLGRRQNLFAVERNMFLNGARLVLCGRSNSEAWATGRKLGLFWIHFDNNMNMSRTMWFRAIRNIWGGNKEIGGCPVALPLHGSTITVTYRSDRRAGSRSRLEASHL